MRQRDNNPIQEQKRAQGHQWVFNTAKKIPQSETEAAGYTLF